MVDLVLRSTQIVKYLWRNGKALFSVAKVKNNSVVSLSKHFKITKSSEGSLKINIRGRIEIYERKSLEGPWCWPCPVSFVVDSWVETSKKCWLELQWLFQSAVRRRKRYLKYCCSGGRVLHKKVAAILVTSKKSLNYACRSDTRLRMKGRERCRGSAAQVFPVFSFGYCVLFHIKFPEFDSIMTQLSGITSVVWKAMINVSEIFVKPSLVFLRRQRGNIKWSRRHNNGNPNRVLMAKQCNKGLARIVILNRSWQARLHNRPPSVQRCSSDMYTSGWYTIFYPSATTSPLH